MSTIVLNSEQRAAVEAPVGPLRVVAGPGSGKTRVLTQRLARFLREGIVPPHRALAVTFTVKATLEMKLRLRADLGTRSGPTQIRTLHSLALSLIRRDPKAAGAPEAFEIGPTAARVDVILEGVIDELRTEPGFPEDLLVPDEALLAIAQIKHRDPFRLIRESQDPNARFARKFDTALHATNTVTHDDLGIMALRALDRNPQLLASAQARYGAVFVDEYQDINQTQFELIRRIASHKVLTVVGDDDQCIYSWRGANPNFLRTFPEDFPGGRTLFLTRNYRCPATVVDASSSVVANNTSRMPKQLLATKPTGPKIRVRRFAALGDELNAVVDDVERLLTLGVLPNDIGVLSRNNDLVQGVVVQMRSRGLPVQGRNPLRTTQGASIMNLVKSVLDGPGDPYFQAAVNVGRRRLRKSQFRKLAPEAPVSPNDVEGVLRAWVQTAEQSDQVAREVSRFINMLDVARQNVEGATAQALLEELFERVGVWEDRRIDPEEDDLTAAAHLVLEVARMQGGRTGANALREVASELQELRQFDEALGDAVSVLTVHRAKGLEFAQLYVLGVQGDIFPNMKFAETKLALMEEERRLFYVALTRAKEVVTLSNHSMNNSQRGKVSDGFIIEIPKSLLEES